MATVNENNVNRENQIKGSRIYYLGNDEKGLRVLIFGNSVTRHSPSIELGWSGDYGMAASSKENDYVHLLFSRLKQDGKNPYFSVSQASEFESDFYKENALDFLSDELIFNPEIIVVRLGDNVYPFEDENIFIASFKRLIDACKTEKTKVIVTGSYFKNRPIEPFLIKLCLKNGYSYLRLDDISEDEENQGDREKFTHEGVRLHPGDKGMKIIADRIYTAINEIL